MTLESDAKFEEKLICAFENSMKNLSDFRRLKNRNFMLESKMAKLNQNINSYITNILTRCSVKTLFYFRNKRVA